MGPDRPVKNRPGARATVVGIGNRGVFGDQIGPRVVDACRGRFGPAVALRDVGTASFSLLDCLEGQELVLVVDASRTGGLPGEIHVREVPRQALLEITAGTGLHQIGPLETIAVAQRLFPETLPRRLLFILVETDGMGDAEMKTAIRRAVTVIDRELARCPAASGPAVKKHVHPRASCLPGIGRTRPGA